MQGPSSIPPVTVALSYFHTKIGPCTLYAHPPGTSPDMVLQEVTGVIDKVTTPGFFTQGSGDYTAINDYFEIPSAWARGAKEEVLLSFIFPGRVTPDVELALQPLARDFERQVTKMPEIYKGFYKDDEGRYPEGDRAAIREMHQQLVSQVTRLHQTANETLLDTWMLKKSEELLPDAILNNPVLTAVCTNYGLAILAAVGRGGKTRLEVGNLSGLEPRMIGLQLPLLIRLDLLTEGTELVLTNRGLKVLQQNSVKDLPEELISQSASFPRIPPSVLSAIQQRARTSEDFQKGLHNNSWIPTPRRLKSFLRYLMGMELLERGR